METELSEAGIATSLGLSASAGPTFLAHSLFVSGCLESCNADTSGSQL